MERLLRTMGSGGLGGLGQVCFDHCLRLDWNFGMHNLSNFQLAGGGPQGDTPTVDTAEQVYISSLALLKMLKHGRAGVPMEVMGLMLGEFVDDYTVSVVDVFAMPQSGTVSTFCDDVNILSLILLSSFSGR